jgi:hypothetical protein
MMNFCFWHKADSLDYEAILDEGTLESVTRLKGLV